MCQTLVHVMFTVILLESITQNLLYYFKFNNNFDIENIDIPFELHNLLQSFGSAAPYNIWIILYSKQWQTCKYFTSHAPDVVRWINNCISYRNNCNLITFFPILNVCKNTEIVDFSSSRIISPELHYFHITINYIFNVPTAILTISHDFRYWNLATT